MSTVVTRSAVPEDLHELVQLCAEHAKFERADYSWKGKRELLNDLIFSEEPKLNCVVIEVDAEICGYASFMKQFSTWSAESYLYLDCLFIRPGNRGHGIGQRVMKLIYSQAISWGCDEIQWQTPAFNTDAIRFYDRLNANSNKKLRYVWPALMSANSDNLFK